MGTGEIERFGIEGLGRHATRHFSSEIKQNRTTQLVQNLCYLPAVMKIEAAIYGSSLPTMGCQIFLYTATILFPCQSQPPRDLPPP